VWDPHELAAVAEVCARHDVVVVADEIHGDLALPHHPWTPFGAATGGDGPRWVSLHGPTKTFGLAGVCDTLLVSPDAAILAGFERQSSQFHLTRNNVFGLASIEAAYEEGGSWVDGLMELVEANADILRTGLPDDIRLVELEGTYLAWLDLRRLDPDIGGMAGWLAREAGIAVSPGHWFGREGAGFARLTIAVPPAWIEQAVEGLRSL
jgi:cystathionine beta-lyase